ncbi:MAG: beta-N-acetylhexosaminidase, partial [Janthinobacterium lividum]
MHSYLAVVKSLPHFRRRAIVAGILAVACAANMAHAQQPSIIPAPRTVAEGVGTYAVHEGTPIHVTHSNADETQVAAYLLDLLHRSRGLNLRLADQTQRSADHGIVLHLEPSSLMPREGYRLKVNPEGITITAGNRAGLFYGAVTLWQLLTQDEQRNRSVTLHATQIDDQPRLPWRGLMLDSARHFQSPQFIEQLIDWMALHKLNTFHWHLTDDQGWRIEIKQYPRLTSVGAFRVEAGPAAQANLDPSTSKPHVYGGFYTQTEVREIVAYAATRNITIVPELDMPGHATAAIAAYPELGSGTTAPLAPSNTWGVHDNLYNLNDSTFIFLQNVLLEVMALFPGPYLHVGGDEATKDQWKASPTIQATMHRLNITTEDELQSYFIRRMETFLNAHGRHLVGWDEILEGGLAPGATVMSWHGVQGGMDAAKTGHDAVLTPQRPLYLNFRQSDASDEPPGRAPLNTLEEVYRFEPAPSAKLNASELSHIIGVEACLWTEHVRTDERIEHMLFPRLAALAEVAWSPEARDWSSFLDRLVPQFDRYQALGLKEAESAFEVRSTETPDVNSHHIEVVLANQAHFGQIRYTLDGSAPNTVSPLYSQPFTVTLPAVLQAATFANGHQMTHPIVRPLNDLSVRKRDSKQLQSCEPAALQMEDDAPLEGKR